MIILIWVIGQRAYNYHGEWKLKSADEFIKDNRIVTLTETTRFVINDVF